MSNKKNPEAAKLLDCAQNANEFLRACDDRSGYVVVYTAQGHYKLPREIGTRDSNIGWILDDFIDDAGLDV